MVRTICIHCNYWVESSVRTVMITTTQPMMQYQDNVIIPWAPNTTNYTVYSDTHIT